MKSQLFMQLRTAKATVELLESNITKGSIKEQIERLDRIEKAKELVEEIQDEIDVERYLEDTEDLGRTEAFKSLLKGD